MLIWDAHFLCNSCNFQYFILGWPTLVLGPSNIKLVPRAPLKHGAAEVLMIIGCMIVLLFVFFKSFIFVQFMQFPVASYYFWVDPSEHFNYCGTIFTDSHPFPFQVRSRQS